MEWWSSGVLEWKAGNTPLLLYPILFYPQQALVEVLHPHSGSLPRSMPLMTAEAHPTPALTLIAPNTQFRSQAPHSMHRSLSVT